VNTDAAFCVRRRQEANLALIRVRLRNKSDGVRVNAEAQLIHITGGRGADDLQGNERRTVLEGGPGGDTLRSSLADDSVRVTAVVTFSSLAMVPAISSREDAASIAHASISGSM
jgi:hypothetical protein